MFLKHFIVEPIQKRHLGLAFWRLTQLLHERTNGKFDTLYNKVANFIQPPRDLPEPERLQPDQIDKVVAELKEQGACILPVSLDSVEIEEIKNFAFSNPAYAKNVNERIMIDRNAIPNEHPRYMWLMESLINLKSVQHLMKDSSLHKIAQSYLGGPGVLTSITLWLDPARDGEFSAHIYHYDNDGPRFLKFFFYITDIDTETGAHKFIRGTHNHTKPEPFRLAKRYDEDYLLNYFGREKEIAFVGPAGTILAEDTAGFHRGITPKRDYRLLMQFQYALVDIPHEEELQKRIKPFPLIGLNPNISKVVKKFYKAA